MKIKRKLLSEGIQIETGTTYEIWELVCPVCGKSWIDVIINGLTEYGGEACVFKDGIKIECCIPCSLKF